MAGFDAVTSHIALVIFPLALDLFLWFGPRMQMKSLVESVFARAAALPEVNTPELSNMMAFTREFWTALADRLNLFFALRSYPVGIPSLMATRLPVDTPAGAPSSWQVSNLGMVLIVWLALTVVGLALGSLYFSVVSQAALAGKVDLRRSVEQWPGQAVQILLLALFWLFLLLIISVPFSCMLSFLMVTGIGYNGFFAVIYGALLIWLLMPLVFSPHGIFVHGYKMVRSVREGVRLTRLTLPTTGLLLLSIAVLSQGLDVLWKVPAEKSWFTLVGIAGHAFVATGLVAATFIYYRDADRWVQRLIQQVKFSSMNDAVRKA